MSVKTTVAAGLTAAVVMLGAAGADAQTAPAQKMDEAYGALIRKHLVDPRFTTELVDHMPASDTVPSPLKFFGRIPGTPGELTYAKDIERYYRELARTSPRVRFWTLGTSEEGRNQIVIAIADEATLKALDTEKAALAALGDPRKTSAEQAKALTKSAKPLYWITSGIHSPETGGPEMLIELAYRLAVEESPLVQNIRNNVVTFITPVVEVDGREKVVDTYYYGKTTKKPKPPLVYWGKYVAHDNNRDGMGQYLKLTQNITKGVLEWHPTVLHDLHEAQSYLYVSTGTGPYNPSLDPVQTDEWWLLAETEVTEMAKRRVPGVWTYGYYDGWVPNYLFWIANAHNSLGRFYEVQSYGPDIQKDLKLGPTVTSREWYRPNPALPSVDWGPRNNTNIQESALLFALDRVGKDRELYLENYWVKTQHAVEGGTTGAVNAWVIPARQTARLNVADMINDLRRQGLEVSTADAAFTAGGVKVAAGDYVIRADQPYRTLADLYFSVQNYPAANPRPYDDTGWTMQYMRNVALTPVHDAAVLKQPMTLLAADVAPKGAITGAGSTVLVNHTGDNELVTFRFRLKDVKMQAAEAAFDAGGKHYAAGTFVIPNAPRGIVEKAVADLGLTAEAVEAAPGVKTHALTVPRIGYLHSWLRTQDEGWWRAALDHYGVPYTYIADTKARAGDLRKRFDVILYPTVGSSARDQVVGVAMNGDVPIPYKKSALTPNLGVLDSADDIRGGLGVDGLAELHKFVQAGGVLIGDGSTVDMLASYGIAAGVNVTTPGDLYTKGALMRGVFTDAASPISYGYVGKELPIYFADAPVISIATPGQGFGGGGDRGGAGGRIAQNITPNAVAAHVSPWPTPEGGAKPAAAPADPVETAPPASRQGGAEPTQKPRTVMAFPAQADSILLSGMLEGGSALTKKALIVDVPDGKGHMVLFGLRPYWRWQTQGSYFLGFNAILNWDHLDAGAPPPPPKADAKAADKPAAKSADWGAGPPRMMLMRTMIGLLAATTLAGAAQAGPTAKLDVGVVEGAQAGDVLVFKGVPFAASTAGANRWRPPQPVAPWTGVRPALSVGAACPQPHLSDAAWANVGPQSEDCLFLNVWRPAKVANPSGVPVMVFIHGGSFTRGSGGVPLYDGTALARRGVVMVTINYRLGRLGYFAHPALTAETSKGPLGNYGLMDQIAALKWVRTNIRALGGDPAKVTVFGESAGAVAVQMLTVSPAARGLFVRAIEESGGGTAAAAAIRGGPLTGEAFGASWAAGVGFKDATPEQLRAIPVADVLKAGPVGPMIDGVLVTRSPGDVYRRGGQQRVGLMAGGNSHEASLFGDNVATVKPALGAAFPELLAAMEAAPHSKAGPGPDLVTQAAAIQPARYLAQRNAAAGLPAYSYYFDQVAQSDRAGAKGADHGWELSYLFGTRLETETWDDTDKAVSQLMGDYWVRFAKTGDPNGKGAPRWAPVTRTASPQMVFDAHPHTAQPTALEERIAAAAVAVAEKAWDAQR